MGTVVSLISTTGGGSQGEVYMARTTRKEHPWDRPGSLVVVKRIKKQDMRVLTDVSQLAFLTGAVLTNYVPAILAPLHHGR